MHCKAVRNSITEVRQNTAPRTRLTTNALGLSFYDMWYPVQSQNGPIQVMPSYASYLFIAETLGQSKTLRISNIYPGRQANGSSITTALGDSSAGQLVAYGFWDSVQPSSHSFPTKLALLNMQIFNQTDVAPRPTTEFDISAFRQDSGRSITLKRLQAPGADVTAGNPTTWAGQTFASGLAVGRMVEEKQTSSIVVVQASEAVLVFL